MSWTCSVKLKNHTGGGASLFDMITENDLVIAFFPCIMFCGISQMNMTLECYRKNHGTIIGAGEYILNRSRERQRFSELLMKMCFVCIDRGIRMIFENPYSVNTYLKNGFIKPPDIVDTDRTKRGDYFHKTTGYWFFNCKPTMLTTINQTPKEDIKYILMHKHQHDTHKPHKERVVGGSKTSGICSEGRSMISKEYARNFIADFILGKPLSDKVYQQQDFFSSEQE